MTEQKPYAKRQAVALAVAAALLAACLFTADYERMVEEEETPSVKA